MRFTVVFSGHVAENCSYGLVFIPGCPGKMWRGSDSIGQRIESANGDTEPAGAVRRRR
jgi:hypothetical protein